MDQIHKIGRRAQDKANLQAQFEAEQEKVANLRRETVTPAMVLAKAQTTELSNDRIMRLGEERLKIRVKMAQIARLAFWKDEISIPEGVRPYRHIMKVTWKSFPYFQRWSTG